MTFDVFFFNKVFIVAENKFHACARTLRRVYLSKCFLTSTWIKVTKSARLTHQDDSNTKSKVTS